MAVEVGIVGPANAGKTTLFNALTHAGAAITPYATVGEKPNVGIAPVADDRLEQVARVVGARNVTPAGVRVVDVPGRGAALLGALRRVDALLAVVDGFSPGASPEDDLAALRRELVTADREHVQRRLERVTKEAKSGAPELRVEAVTLERILAVLDAERPLSAYPEELPAALEPLTTKPLIEIVNGPGGIDAKLEAELTELDPAEADAFREGEESALDQVMHSLFATLGLITFFTANENEARAWTLRRGETALAAAASVHSDMSRGFIRCEVISWRNLVDCGSRAEAQKRGLLRLEGKAYVVEDGDVLTVRFNV